ncbi:MAG: hypothetical protein J0I07_40630 [Myxococcales bacterium]|nr:hypothetical protein [Myxococcales bacterium]
MRRSRDFNVTSAVLILSSLLVSTAIGCSDPKGTPTESAPVCLETGIDESCTPAYEPTYDALYANTFQRSCAASGVSCHASTGKQGGVDFGDPESGYEGLRTKLRAGEPECSILVHRIVATDGKVRMPPGRSLTAGEQCAIIKWVADGARR